MQNADQIAALFSGQPMPGNQELTQVEPTVGIIAPVAASTVAGLPGATDKTPTAITDDLSKILPDLPAIEPVAFTSAAFLAKRIGFLGDNGMSPILASDTGHEVFGFR